MVQLAVTADLVPDGLALMVGLGGRLGVVCSGAVLDAGLRGVAVARVNEALERIRTRAPRVVIVPGTLDREERRAVVQACEEALAELVELSTVVEIRDVAHAIAKAVAVSERRRQRVSRVAIASR